MNLKDLPIGAKFKRFDFDCEPYTKVFVQSDPGGLYGLAPDNWVAYFPGYWDVEWLDRPEVKYADLKVGERFRCSVNKEFDNRILRKIDRQYWKTDGFDGAAIDEEFRLFGLKNSYTVTRV